MVVVVVTCTDEVLLARGRSGDDAALAELYRRHLRLATLTALRWRSPSYLPDDLVADAFTALFAALKLGAGPEGSVPA